jgi:hypothetical protein
MMLSYITPAVGGISVNRAFSLSLFVSLGLLSPLAVRAASVNPTAIPDGTYTVKVEKVVDAKHVMVQMDNGSEATLAAGRPSVDFSKVQTSDQIKISLIGGSIMVYLDLTTH